jgi:hypothetical protein
LQGTAETRLDPLRVALGGSMAQSPTRAQHIIAEIEPAH